MYLVVGGLVGVGMSLFRSMTVRPLLFDISLFQSRVPEDNADKGRKSEVVRDIDIIVEIEIFSKFCLFLLSDVR